MGPKSQQDALYLRFFTKKLLLSCAFLSKKRTFSKEHSLLTPIFGQKNVNFFKNTVLSCQFFQNFHEKPPAAIPIFGKKTSILSKLYYIFGQKVNRMPFFLIFQVKTTAFMPTFCQKTSILSKTQCSHFHILSQNVHSLKNIVLNVILSRFFMKNPLLSCPYLVKKTTILSKLHFIFYNGSKK